MSQVFCSRLSKHDWPEFCVDPNHPNEDDWRVMVTWRAAVVLCEADRIHQNAQVCQTPGCAASSCFAGLVN